MTSAREELLREEALLTAERLAAAVGNPVLAYAFHYHRNDRGDPLSFLGRPWLLALYMLWGASPAKGSDVAIMKATQVGVSEWAIVLSWAWCGELGLRLMYVLPRDEDRTAFYAMRIKKPLRHTPRYQALTKQTAFDSRSEYLMSIGRGFFRLTASNAPASFVSTPLDAYVIDEIDQCDQANIQLAEDRLSWPDSLKVRIRIGNPTIDHFGIAGLFESGTKHRWHVLCDTCGRAQAPDFFLHVVAEAKDGSWRVRDEERAGNPNLGDLRMVCECGGFLDRTGVGAWIAEHPERERRSFQVPKTIDGAVPLRGIVREFLEAEDDPKKLQRFWNSVLGLPYAPKGAKLTKALVLSRRFAYRDLHPDLWGQVRTMGIDVGSPHTVVVSDIPEGQDLDRLLISLGKKELAAQHGPAFDLRLDAAAVPKKVRPLRRLIYAGKAKTLLQVDELVKRFRPRCICIDALPEVEAVKGARERWGKLIGGKTRVWRVEYLHDNLRDVGVDYVEGLARVDRTTLLDMSVRDWTDGWRIVPSDVELLARGRFMDEVCEPTRVQEENSRGVPVFRWTKSDKADHFFHAEGYDRLALELCRLGGISVSDQDVFSGL